MTVDPARVIAGEDAPERAGRYVLYWMTAARRTRWSPALEHAIARARAVDRPLVVVEALRVDDRWASDRLHRFVIDGMRDQRDAFARAGVTYLPYVEPEPGRGRELLEALARDAALVVADEATPRLGVRVELVDGAGVLPLRVFERAFLTASSFRRAWQRVIGPALVAPPAATPLARLPAVARGGEVRGAVLRRWPAASDARLAGELADLPIDHGVAPAATRGGARAAARALATFVDERLDRYHEGRRHPDADATSGLSPYLHAGQLGAAEVVAAVLAHEAWDPSRVVGASPGPRWWGVSDGADAFLDELVTWRELAQVFAFHVRDHDRYAALPAWARRTLAAHAGDPREAIYSLADLAAARTDDALWNAAQRQLVREGRIHNQLRMLWGKRVLAWTRTPERAFAVLTELNNRYALDGRDPSSSAGIAWCFGRFDRPWGPERPVYGLVRYMSSASAARKLHVREYLRRYGEA